MVLEASDAPSRDQVMEETMAARTRHTRRYPRHRELILEYAIIALLFLGPVFMSL